MLLIFILTVFLVKNSFFQSTNLEETSISLLYSKTAEVSINSLKSDFIKWTREKSTIYYIS